MRILKITELSHSFVEKSIFNNAEMVVDEGDKIGIVGPNGSGKSSLLKMIVGQIVPDNWKIQMHPNTRIGYLDQYADIDKMQTVNDYLYGSFAELYKLNNMVDELYASVDALDVDEHACGFFKLFVAKTLAVHTQRLAAELEDDALVIGHEKVPSFQ